MVEKQVKISPKLSAAARYWKEALRLDDWRLEFHPASDAQLADMKKRNRTAFVAINIHHRTAQIVLRRLDQFNQDVEEDIVHELLHLVFAQSSVWVGQGREGIDDIPFEQGLNAVTDALVELKRK